MITMINSFRSVAPDTPVQDTRGSSPKSGFSSLIRGARRAMKSDPLVVLIGFFDAIFYGGVIALLAVL
jgi:hypothetical protein